MGGIDVRAAHASHAFGLVLADELARNGVDHVCIAPGSRSAPLALGLAHEPRLTAHVLLDERSASFFALGIAKASCKPVALVSTSGTAAANLHPAVLEAAQARVPLIVLTADRPVELRDTGSNQTVDQIKLYGDTVRWFCEVGAPEGFEGCAAYWRSVVCRAAAEATGSPPGPVHLNVALREPLVPLDDDRDFAYELAGRSDGRPWVEIRRAPSAPGEEQAGWLASVASATERGLVVAGSLDPPAVAVLDFARAARWPVLAEPASNLRSGEGQIDVYEAVLRSQRFVAEHRPDFVLRMGKGALSRTLEAYLRGVPQALVDPYGAWLDAGRNPGELVECAPEALCREAAKAVPARAETQWWVDWLSARTAARRAVDAVLDASDLPTEPRTARDLAARVPSGSNLVVGASMPVRELDYFMAPRTDVTVWSNRGANGIDGVVSTALGVAEATGSPTFALVGDLTLLHDQNGLLHARNMSVEVTYVVLNNDGGGIFSFLPQASDPEYFELLFGTPQGIDYGTLASVYGCGYARLERASDLEAALGRVHEHATVGIVEVPGNRAANVDLHHEIWAAASRAVLG